MRLGALKCVPAGLLAAGLLVLTTPTAAQQQEGDKQPAAMQGQQQILMHVSGMSCDGCRQRLEESLAALPGVDSVAVSVEKGEALLWVRIDDDNGEISDETLTTVATDRGFKVEGIERHAGMMHPHRKP